MMQARQEGVMQENMAKGDMMSRQMEASKVTGMLGRAGQRLSAANQARQAATNSIMGGAGELAGMGASFLPGGGMNRNS